MIYPTDVIPTPFRHAIVDGVWSNTLLRQVAREFPEPDDVRWRRYLNKTESKLEGPPPMWGPFTQMFINNLAGYGSTIAAAFNMPDLTMEAIGGGYHYILPGGYLKVHTDFNTSPVSKLYRRINLLVYLNEDWQDPGGKLELWPNVSHEPTPEEKISIAPEFNRTVVFETSDQSWHGHPIPAIRARKSIAVYFFSKEQPSGYHSKHSTLWHPSYK